jgi:hypothetical protein
MKLSDTHLVLLSGAAQRDDHALEIPTNMVPAEAEKVVSKLAGARLIEEIDATGELPVWRRVDDAAFALRITGEGLKAVGVDEGSPAGTSSTNGIPPGAVPARRNTKNTKTRRAKNTPAKGMKRRTAHATKGKASAPPKTSRTGSKLEEVKALLMRKRGATIKEMMDTTNWLPHTTRAVLTGLRKRGFGVERETVKDKPSVYRITADGAASIKARARSASAA